MAVTGVALEETQTVEAILLTGISVENFGENTVTDGTNYYATLQAAVEAVVGNAGAALYCKPSADVGSLQHAPVIATLTIYGNGAAVTGGAERDFDLGNTDPNGGKDINADGFVALTNLDGKYVVGTKPTATVNDLGAMVIPAGEYGVWNGSSYSGTSLVNNENVYSVTDYDYNAEDFVSDFVAEATIVDGDHTEYSVEKDAIVGVLTYKRNLASINYNALYVPFEIPVEDFVNNYDFFYFNDVHSEIEN